MRTATWALAILALVSCGGVDGTSELIGSFTSTADAMAAEGTRHSTEVAGAVAVGDVTSLIDAHAARMAELRDRMRGIMDRMRGCDMGGSLGAALDDAAGQLDMMDAEMSTYRSAHTTHASIEECRRAAADHSQRVGERAARMRGHGGHMMGGMSCGGIGMMSSWGG